MTKKQNNEITIRSSAAEYLTYISTIGDQPSSVELRYEDENIWLTQRLMAELYGVGLPTINEHIKKIYEDRELSSEATIRNYRIVQTEGNRQVSREVKHYNLQMIIAVGFKVNNERAVQFRKWANNIVKDFTIQGWVMDEERLKNGGTILTNDYFEKQLEKVSIAKNYLNQEELKQLERLVSAYLDLAELQAIRHIPMTMNDWEERLNGFLTLWNPDILKDSGKVSAELAKMKAETEFEKFRIVQDRLYQSDFDRFVQLEDKTKE